MLAFVMALLTSFKGEDTVFRFWSFDRGKTDKKTSNSLAKEKGSYLVTLNLSAKSIDFYAQLAGETERKSYSGIMGEMTTGEDGSLSFEVLGSEFLKQVIVSKKLDDPKTETIEFMIVINTVDAIGYYYYLYPAGAM